ncbi:MAG: MFS transporter, partial [Bryobacteraceae bacterium]
AGKRESRPGFHWQELRGFSAAFWWVAVIGSILTVARFSDAFLVLRSSQLGIHDAMVPLVMVVMNVVYAISSYPAGRLSDRIDRRVVLMISAAILVGADIVLAQSRGTAGLIVGVMLWGLHMGLSQGLLTAMVTDTSPSDRRGTAFGLFSLLTGVAVIVASILAGELWDRIGAPATFYAGAGFAAIAMLGLLAQFLAPPKKGTPASRG